jgi:sugar phosphate isomerase/epimerase
MGDGVQMEWLMRNIGIVQGRLSLPEEGFQECPLDWQKEFDEIERLGLTHIEWIITEKKFDANPFFEQDLSSYRHKISSVCCDFLVTKDIFDRNFIINKLVPVCHTAQKKGIKNITVPLLEESDISDLDDRNVLKNIFSEMSEKFQDLIFNFEIESSQEVIMDFLKNSDKFMFTYDTGNLTSSKVNHESCISSIANKIKTVHLKDRNLKGQTVFPGLGNTDFETIFKTIVRLKINPVFTIQTARGADGLEQETIKNHKDYFLELYEKQLI